MSGDPWVRGPSSVARICVIASTALLGALVLGTPLAKAAFPGANGKIAFADCGPQDCGIFVMNPDGSGRTQITHNRTSFCGHGICTPGVDEFPAWSADGQKLAYGSLRADIGESHVFVVNADGSGQKQLTRRGSLNSSPAWSPDGRKIVFTSNRRGFREIYVMNSSGGGQKRLTKNNVADDGPEWSPDGQKIAFWRDVSGTSEIFVMAPNGGAQTQLTFSDPSNPFDSFGPSWSPDSAKIAFTSDAGGAATVVNVMNADGSGRTFLTSGFGPAWSPDAQKVAYVLNGVISVANTDGTNSVQLGPGRQPDWQPISSPPPLGP